MTETIDFFVAGGTLRANDPSYVTRPADHDLLQQLRAGEFCYVLTPRQMGKSSLMVRTAQRLRADGTRVAVIDLTSIGTGSSELSPEQWYLGLLSRVRTQLRLTTDVQAWWGEHAALGVAQRFTLFLHDVLLTECSESIVILIDEIDSTLNLNFRDDFFAAIRAVYNERATDPSYQRLTFALFGVATPTQLIQDRDRTPFNIGRRIDLREFTFDDAQPLRDGLAASFPEQADTILQRIFYWTSGHPYLTQKICQTLQAEAVATAATDIVDDVDAIVQRTFFSDEGRKDPNLTFVQDRIANSPDSEKRRMLQLYRRVQGGDKVVDDDRSPVQNRLELYGLVDVAQGRLQVRNRIYARVFDGAWIGSMMPVDRRQRRAVLAGVGALVLLLGVGIWIILQPTTECSVYQGRFLDSEASDVRLSALADLIDQGCQPMAEDLFYDLGSEEQKALFVSLENKPGERERLVSVIDALYRTLDTVPEHDTALISEWSYTLKLAEIEEENKLRSSISFWKEGREYANGNRYALAVISYENALREIPDNRHPALHYDIALAYIELEEYGKALEQLDAILRIAETMPETPTPTISPTPSTSPTGFVIFTVIPSSTSTDIDLTNATKLPIQVDDASQKNTVTDASTRTITSIVTDTLETRSLAIGTDVADTRTPDIAPVQYRKRFHNASAIKNAVKVLVEENSALLSYYQENDANYRYLADLDIAAMVLAAVTQTSTALESAAIIRPTQQIPSPVVTISTPPGELQNLREVPYVYRIDIKNCKFDPTIRRQTGFRIQGLIGIVTALHGLADCETVYATANDGQEQFFDLYIRQVDIERDIVLLASPELDALPANGLAVSPLLTTEILTASLRVVGYPLGLVNQDSDIIESIRDIEALDGVIPDAEETIDFIKRRSPSLDIQVLNIQAQFLPGHSGAPVIDGEDRIVAIGNGGLRGGSVGRSWAIPWDTVNFQPVESDEIQDKLAELATMDIAALSFSSTFPHQVNVEAPLATYRVQVIDDNGQPVANAEVLLTHGAGYEIGMTDSNGFFMFRLTNDDTVDYLLSQIQIEADGYEPFHRNVFDILTRISPEIFLLSANKPASTTSISDTIANNLTPIADQSPEELTKRFCASDDNLTTSQLITYVKDEVIIEALIDYKPELKGVSKNILLQLVHNVSYLETGFIADTQTYCVSFVGEVIPKEVIAFLDRGNGATEPNQVFSVRYTPTELTGLIRPVPDVGRLSGNCPRFEYRGAERQFEITEVLNVDYVAMPGQPAKAWAKVTYVDGSNKQDVAFFAESEGLLGVLELAGGSQEIVALFRNCLETQAPIPTLTATVATTLTPSPTATPQPTATVTPLEVLKPTYPCEAEFISPRGVSPVMITFRQRPNEGNSGTQSYQPGDRVIIKQADESGNWYLVAELNNLERGWASAEYFTDCSKNVD